MIDILSIDEAIALERQVAKEQRDHIGTFDDEYSKKCEVWAEEHEQIANWLEELKVIKEMDLSIPQHFTKEQSDWIKKYCINRNKEFYNMAIDDFANWLVEQGILGNRCIADGEITDYGKVYAKKYKEQLKEEDK